MLFGRFWRLLGKTTGFTELVLVSGVVSLALWPGMILFLVWNIDPYWLSISLLVLLGGDKWLYLRKKKKTPRDQQLN